MKKEIECTSRSYGRKDFLKMFGGGVLGSIAMLSCAKPQDNQSSNSIGSEEVFHWKMVTTWPPNFPLLGEICHELAETVEKMSRGKLKIEVYGGGELVPPLEAFDAVQSGSVELGHGSPYYWAGKIPASQIFAAIPFGMSLMEYTTWIYAGGGLDLYEALYAEHGIIPFPMANTGMQMGGWYNKRIDKPEDLKGLKMRIPGLGGKVLKKAGGSPVLTSGAEIYTNLERGVIDATEWIGPYHDYLMGFHEIAKYAYFPGWHEVNTAGETLVNAEAYHSLPTYLQKILSEACASINVKVSARFEYQNAIHLKKIMESGDVEFREFPEEVLVVLREYSNEVLAELADSDPMSALILKEIAEFRNTMKEWYRMTEKI